MISRDLDQAVNREANLVIVGGGVYGIALTLEASAHGLRPILLERDDFGGRTSWNSLRILHGGLRYLQKLDLRRFRESVAERRWFFRTYPSLVRPLECLMPLYGRGLRRPSIMRGALAANDLLSISRNRGVDEAVRLPRGRIVGPRETAQLWPGVPTQGLDGAAIWYDGVMSAPQRVLMAMLHQATALGARAFNYAEVTELMAGKSGVEGVRLTDRISGRTHTVTARRVVVCAGPWSRPLLQRWGIGDRPELFRPSLAFNLYLRRRAPADPALAVAPPRRGARTYFLYPHQGGVLAGTFHAPAQSNGPVAEPGPDLVAAMLDELNAAVPGWELSGHDVARVLWGALPVNRHGTVDLADRPVIAHFSANFPGLFAVSGVKFTTARRVARSTLGRLDLELSSPPRGAPGPEELGIPHVPSLPDDPASQEELVRWIVREEAVRSPEDLLLRRTDWGLDPRNEERLASAFSHLFQSETPVLDPER